MIKQIYEQELIEPQVFTYVTNVLKDFFTKRGYKESFPQPRLSILAACEDPKTIKTFEFDGELWPLPQTSQMWLERDLIVNKDDIDGVFCVTASYRDEPNPIKDRHLKSFPMFEAEHKGDMDHLIQTISECCVHLGLINKSSDIPIFKYDDLCEHYNVDILENEHEEMMWKEYGDVVGITYFPERTSPFFNMKDDGVNKNGEKISKKVDFIICGQETFGCAEREIDPTIMKRNFQTISDGEYSKLLYDKFTKERVLSELDEFLSLPMIKRWGFGMGYSRLIRSLKIKKII
jgi:aspartyl/asparaginyl-tRNA synthetase